MRLTTEEIFNVLKEARDFYNQKEVKQKIKEKLSKDLPYAPELKFFSFYFERINGVEVIAGAKDIKESNSFEEGQLQVRCFVGKDKFLGMGEGYAVEDINPTTKDGFMNTIKKGMEGSKGALYLASTFFSRNIMNASLKERRGRLAYGFLESQKPSRYITNFKLGGLPDVNKMENIVKKATSIIEKYRIEKRSSAAKVSVEKKDKILLNSEGTEIIYDPQQIATASFRANTDTDFGSVVVDTGDIGENWQKILTSDNIERLLSSLQKDINEQKRAVKIPTGQYDSLFFNQGLAVLLHEAYAAHLCSLDSLINQESGALSLENMGKKIAIEEMTVISDPFISKKGGWGFYNFDDEGTPAKKVILIKEGRLEGVLSDRKSAAKLNVLKKYNKDITLEASLNGHGRIGCASDIPPEGSGISPRIGNLIIVNEGKQKTFSQLKKEFCKLLKERNKEYGVMMDCSSGMIKFEGEEFDEGKNITSTFCILLPDKVYKFYPNGKVEPVIKNINVVMHPRDLLPKIYSLGGKRKRNNSFCAAESGYVTTKNEGPAGIVLDVTVEEVKERDVKKAIT